MKDKYKWLKDFCKERKFSKEAAKLLLQLAKVRDSTWPTKNWEEETKKRKEQEHKLVDALVKVGVYPSEPTKVMKEHGYSAYKMYESWGVLWAFYTEPLACPYCKADLRDKKNGPPFKREIGIYDTAGDRTSHFICPDCKERIERI